MIMRQIKHGSGCNDDRWVQLYRSVDYAWAMLKGELG
jgi:hypothetical protein